MKIRITLDNGGGALDEQIVEGEEGEEALSDKIKAVIAGWRLDPGDTILIRED